MLTLTLILSGITLIATIAHLRSQQTRNSIPIEELWKIRAYQQDGFGGR